MKYVLFSSLQMKNLFCKKIAACLCMKPPSSPAVEPRLISMKNRYVGIADNGSTHPLYDDLTPSCPISNADSMKKLLEEIRDLLKTQVENVEEHSYKADKEDELKHDWMLAAAVIDRICAITFTVVFIVGTLFFFIVFATHP